jgi:toxin FitB
MYLLDTNVISELRKRKPHGAVLAWAASVAPKDIQIPAVAAGELQDGVELTRLQDPAKAIEIERWIDRILQSFAVVPMDGVLFRESSRLMVGKSDRLLQDAMIAATARVHHLIVVTRNVKDFASFNVQVFNPFTGKPKALNP